MPSADYSGYINGMLVAVAGVLGVFAVILAISAFSPRGSRLQLVMAWVLVSLAISAWLLALTAEHDMFHLVLLSRIVLAFPAVVSMLWLRRCIRVFRERRNELAPLVSWPWIAAVAGAFLMFCLDDQRGLGTMLRLEPGGTLGATLFWAAMVLIVVGVVRGGSPHSAACGWPGQPNNGRCTKHWKSLLSLLRLASPDGLLVCCLKEENARNHQKGR